MLAPPPPPKIYAYAFVDHGAWGARNTVMLKKFQNISSPISRNTVMLKKFQKFRHSGIYVQARTMFPKILEFFEHCSVL